ncbi:hypothetical protein [Pseudoneobacillus sp. C159]
MKRKKKDFIEYLQMSETKEQSIWNHFITKKDTFIGEKPILILVIEKDNVFRARNWCETIYGLTKVHVKAVRSLVSVEVESYINEHGIHTIFVLDIEHIGPNQILISSNEEAIQSFLTQSLLIEHNLFCLNTEVVESDPVFSDKRLTFMKIGKLDHLSEFFDLLKALIRTIPKLSLQYKSEIVGLSDRQVLQNLPLNRVELHIDAMRQYGIHENEYIIVYNPINFKYSIGCVKSTSKLEPNQIVTTLGIRTKLKTEANSRLIIHPIKKMIGEKIHIQDAKNLASGVVFVSSNLYKDLMESGADCFEIVNLATASSFDIHRDKIRKSSSPTDGAIKLSYLQREFLDLEHPPDTLSPYYFDLFNRKNVLDADQITFLNDHYSNQKVHSIKEFEDKQKLKEIFKKVGYNQVAIYPIYTSKMKKKRNVLTGVFKKFLNLSIRSSKIQLNVIRPYSTDESSNIVRMPRSAMSLLGIDENDLIILHYRGRSVVVPVLELDSTESIKETNIVPNESRINISIGIPAHLRFKLGIKQIGKACEVERNLSFLFKKNASLQFLPILATIIAIFSFADLKFWLRVILCIVTIPISSYITLSTVREKIPKN